MSRRDALEALADYFTGSAVVYHSLCLRHGATDARMVAENFFITRASVGVEGYANRHDALRAIQDRLGIEEEK